MTIFLIGLAIWWAIGIIPLVAFGYYVLKVEKEDITLSEIIMCLVLSLTGPVAAALILKELCEKMINRYGDRPVFKAKKEHDSDS